MKHFLITCSILLGFVILALLSTSMMVKETATKTPEKTINTTVNNNASSIKKTDDVIPVSNIKDEKSTDEVVKPLQNLVEETTESGIDG
jgi:hypothetical protein